MENPESTKVRYSVDGNYYDIPSEQVEDFEKDMPQARQVYRVGEETYAIPLNERAGFTADNPNAQYWNGGYVNPDYKPESQQQAMEAPQRTGLVRGSDPVPAKDTQPDYGLRNDGTKKGNGWLGPINLPNGNVATEYSIGVDFDGKETEIPTLVPTLTPEEVDLMRDDIIPNNKPVPEGIAQKAIEHAKKQMSEGKSVWAEEKAAEPEEKSEEDDKLGFWGMGWQGAKQMFGHIAKSIGETAGITARTIRRNLFGRDSEMADEALKEVDRRIAAGEDPFARTVSRENPNLHMGQIEDYIASRKGEDDNIDSVRAKLLSDAGERSNFEKLADRFDEKAERIIEENSKEAKNGWAAMGGLLPMVAATGASVGLAVAARNPKYAEAAIPAAKAIGESVNAAFISSSAGAAMNEARKAGANDEQTASAGILAGAIMKAIGLLPFKRFTQKALQTSSAEAARVATKVMENPETGAAATKEIGKAMDKVADMLGLTKGHYIKQFLGQVGTTTADFAALGGLEAIVPLVYENPDEYPVLANVLQGMASGARDGIAMGILFGGITTGTEYSARMERFKKNGAAVAVQVDFEKNAAVDAEGKRVDASAYEWDGQQWSPVAEGNGPKSGYAELIGFEDAESGKPVQWAFVQMDGKTYRVDASTIDPNSIMVFKPKDIKQAEAQAKDVVLSEAREEGQSASTPEEMNRLSIEDSYTRKKALLDAPDGGAPSDLAKFDVERADAVKEGRKEAVRTSLETSVGQPFWRSEDVQVPVAEGEAPQSKTENIVHSVKYSDGREVYIIAKDENGNYATVDAEGNHGFLSEAQLQEEQAKGEAAVSYQTLDEYLDGKVGELDTQAEQQRMLNDGNNNLKALQQKVQQEGRINVGTPESEQWGTIVDMNPAPQGGIVVAVEGEEQPRTMTWHEVATAYRMPLEAKTNEDIVNARISADEEVRRYNDGIAEGAQLAVPLAEAGEEVATYEFRSAENVDGDVIIRAKDPASGEVVDLTPEMVSNLDALLERREPAAPVADVQGNPVPEVKAPETPVEIFDDPAANELGISRDYAYTTKKGRTVVDGSKLWAEKPTLWAEWNDRNPNRVVPTKEYLEGKLKDIDKDVEAARKALEEEARGSQNPDRMEELQDALDTKVSRQQEVQSLVAKYESAEAIVAQAEAEAKRREAELAKAPVEKPVEASVKAEPVAPAMEQAPAIPATAEEVMGNAQKALDELAAQLPEAENAEERQLVMDAKAKVLQDMLDMMGAKNTIVTTMSNLADTMKAAGASEESLSEVRDVVEQCKQDHDVIEGFYDPETDGIFMIADGLPNAKYAVRIHAHEDKHMENKRTRANVDALSTGVRNGEMEKAIWNYKHSRRYYGKPAVTLADEVLAISAEIAEETGVESIPERLRELGIVNEEFINFAKKNIDNGRRNGQHRSLAERSALQHTDAEIRGGQNGGNRSGESGNLGGSGVRPSSGGAQESGRGESAVAEDGRGDGQPLPSERGDSLHVESPDEVGRKDGRDTETVSDRVLGQEGNRTDAEGGRGTEEAEPAGAVASQEEAAKAEQDLREKGVASNDEEARFSVRYAPDASSVDAIAEDIAKSLGISKRKALRWIKSETGLAPIILDEHNSPYLNYEADGRYAAIKVDSDYPQGTVDFNNICRKRLAFTNLYQRLQKNFPDKVITGEDLAKIRDIMKNNGYTVACGLCYVEDRRQLLGEIGRFFIDEMKDDFNGYTHGRTIKEAAKEDVNEEKVKKAEKYRQLIGDDVKEDLSLYDLLTLEGSEKLAKEHPGIYAAFQQFNADRGQQAGNLFEGYAEYKREILKWNKAKVKSVNANGGLRIFSYSDFEAHHLIDIVQIIQDCAKKGVMIQGYTKVPAFAKALAETGAKINRSLIPQGDTGIVDGELAYDPVEGIDINDPDFIPSNDNIGNILVGINDEQIRLAMADPFIHYIIPYHSNQSGILRTMKQTGAWTNYKNEQTEKGPDVGKHGGVNIYKDILIPAEESGKPIRTEKQLVERFLAICKENGWTPRFERFLDKNAKGEYVYTPGYYKLLVDFKLFDENGRILPQRPVEAEFNDAFNAKILNDYVEGVGTEANVVSDDVYNQIVDELGFREEEQPSVPELTEAQKKALEFVNGKPVEDGEIQYSIRGILGAENDEVAKANLSVAEEMEKAGKDAKAIWLATGWEKGADGKWRNEIPDGKPKTFPINKREMTVGDIIDAPELFEAYPDIKDYKVKIMRLAVAGDFNEVAKTVRLDREYNTTEIIPEENKQDVRDYFNANMSTMGAEAAQKAARTKWGVRTLDNYGISTVMHELQHAIQYIEGFAKGGSTKGQMQDYLEEERKRRPEMVDFARGFSQSNTVARLRRAGKQKMEDVIERNILATNNKELENRLKAMLYHLQHMSVADYYRFVYDADSLLKNSRVEGKDRYRKLAGEVESRNVEQRMRMTPEERRNTPLSETESVPREEQGLRFSVSADIAAKYPNWMDNQTSTEDEKNKRGQSTQVAGTVGTYKKVGDWIGRNVGKDAKILDASSGLGLGTLELRNHGFDIEDIEPYPGKAREEQPTYGGVDAYQQAMDDGKEYDYIISNAVLNVIPDDWRDAVLKDMATLLKPGGKMFINTRKAGEEKTIKNKIELESPQEVLVGTPEKITSYQRFFTAPELKEYVEGQLGDGYTVEVANEKNSGTKGLAAVVVTKESPSEEKPAVEEKKKEVSKLFNDAISGKLKGKPVSIGKLTTDGKQFLEGISGITMKPEIDFVLNPSDMVHIYNDHFGENEKDKGSNLPLTIDDIKNIVDVIMQPETVVYLGNDGNTGTKFAFLKPSEGGAYNLIEVYGDKRGNLTAKTFYNTKRGVSQRAIILEKESLHSTPKATGATSLNAKVPVLFDISKSGGINYSITAEQDEETKKLFDAAKERFGTTRDLREAGYILPDGTMLDFSGRHWTSGGDNSWLNGMRQVDHREIADIEFERDGNTPSGLETDMSDFIRRGAIRINYPNSINLSVKPTAEQRAALERMLRDSDFVRVDFGDGSHTDHSADYEGERPVRVLNDIKRYFDEGYKPEGTESVRYSVSNQKNEMFVSNAQRALDGIRMEKATPEQWLKMLEKSGGLKAGEDKWLGLSDWLKEQGNVPEWYDDAISIHNYDNSSRAIAHGIKDGDMGAIDKAAAEMAKSVQEGDILVPIPSRSGRATNTLSLANRIVEISGNGVVADVLEGKERESLYDMKKAGGELPDPSELGFDQILNSFLPTTGRILLVDNVLATGTTMKAALSVIPEGQAFVYAKDESVAPKKKSLTKQEIADFIAQNKIQIEEVNYSENGDDSAIEKAHPGFYRAYYLEEDDFRGDVVFGGINDLDAAIELYNNEHENKIIVDDSEETRLYDPGHKISDDDYDLLLDYGKSLVRNGNADFGMINPTRLSYTTEGLENNREIALTVPTIDPWNENDKIHFGDAGEGRAVAWVRFGDAKISAGDYAEKRVAYEEAARKLDEVRGRLQAKYLGRASRENVPWFELATPEELAELDPIKADERAKYNAMQEAKHNTKPVLFIDEIQSKRHQEGREKGYKDGQEMQRAQELTSHYWELQKEIDRLREEERQIRKQIMESDEGKALIGEDGLIIDGKLEEYAELENKSGLKENSIRITELLREQQDTMLQVQQNANHASEAIPAAPFEKNWHELAMKRMLRLAAEEGYDAVAWTTGDQQAERYNLAQQVSKIEISRDSRSTEEKPLYEVFTYNSANNVIDDASGMFNSERLGDMFGKELAARLAKAADENKGELATVEGENLKVGGEGMRGFYDDMLPRFMNKYGKQWGAKVEDGKVMAGGREIDAHIVPVNEAMKESVMQGQLMFSMRGKQKAQEQRVATIDKASEEGLASVIGEEEARDLYDGIYTSIPEKLMRPIVEKAIRKGDFNVRQRVKEYVHKLAEGGIENDKTGMLIALSDEIRYLTGDENLTDNDIRYMLWKDTAEKRDGDLLSLAQDRAMRNRWGVGSENAVRYSAKGEFEEATEEAREKLDEKVAQAEADRKEGKKEAQTLSGRLKPITKAMSVQKAYDKATVDNIVRFAKEILKKGGVSEMKMREASRLMTLIANATGKSPKFSSRYADQLMDMLLDHIVADEEAKFMKLVNIKDKTVAQSGVEKQGKLDALGQITMKAFRENMGSSIEEIDRRIVDMSDRINNESKSVRDDAFAEYQGLNLARRYAEEIKENLEEEVDLKNELEQERKKKNDGSIDKKAFEEYEKATVQAIRDNKTERVDMYRNLADKLANIISGSAEKAAGFREADRQRIEDIHHDSNRDMQGVPKLEQLRDGRLQRFLNSDVVRFAFKPLATFDQMLRLLGRKNINGEGYLYNRFMRQWEKATGDKSRGFFEATKELDEKASEVFGKKMRWSDLYKEERGLPTMEVDFMDGGEMRTHELTQGNLLYIYMVDKMTDGRMKLRKMGITEDDVKAIKDVLDPRFIQLADWLQEDYLVKKRNKYNEVHERMFGAPMAAIENYFPIKILSNARIEDVDLGNKPDGNQLSSTTTGSIIKRRKNSLALDIMHTDAFSLVIDHIDQMEDWAAFAEFRRDMNTLLSYKTFRNQVKNMNTVYGSGDTLWKNFKDVCAIATGSYQPKVRKGDTDRIALNVAKGVTGAKIAFRVNTAIKQLLSFPAYFPDARADLLAKSMATPWKSWKWCMENLPLFEKRWKSRIAGDTRLMDTDSDWAIWKDNVVKTAARLGMTPNAFVDATTVAIGAKAMYDSKYARYIRDGYSEEEADKRAKQDAEILYNQTQQSSEGAFVSTIQLDRTWLSVMLSTYRNASMAYQRQMHDALRTVGRMMTPGYRERSITFMARQRMNDGIGEEEAFEGAKKQYNRQYFRSAARLAVFGYGLQLLWKLGSDMWYLLLGDDDDEKKRIFETAVLSELASPIEGLAGGNVVSDAWGSREQDKVNVSYGIKPNNNRFSRLGLAELPVVSDIKTILSEMGYDKPRALNDIIDLFVQAGIGVNPKTITDAVVAAYDAFNGDMDTMKEFALFMMRINQVPQSTVDKFMIDEINMTDADARKLSTEELAKRYAQYKFLRNSPYTSWMYNEGDKAKKLKNYSKQFQDKVKERMALKDEEEAPATAEETYKSIEKEMKAFQTELNRTVKDKDTVTEQALKESPEYQQYLIWKRHQKGINKLTNGIKKTQDENLRQRWEAQLRDSIQTVINELEAMK